MISKYKDASTLEPDLNPSVDTPRKNSVKNGRRVKPSQEFKYIPSRWFHYLALIILTISCYAPIFKSGLYWSEYDQVKRSSFQSMEKWTEVWTSDVIFGHDPITLSSYFLEQTIPLSPAISHHLLNLLLHVLAAILLLKVLESINLPGAFSASLVFALHPVVLQTIFWSGFRSELTGLVVFLSALYMGLKNHKQLGFFIFIFISLLAYWLHPLTLFLPIILGLCIFYQNAKSKLSDYNRLLPLIFFAFLLGLLVHRNEMATDSNFEQLLSICAQNLFFNINQALFYTKYALFHPLNESYSSNFGTSFNLLPFILFFSFYILIIPNIKKRWARGLLLGLSTFLLLSTYNLSKFGTFIDGTPAQVNHSQYIALPFLIAVIICPVRAIFYKLGKSGAVFGYLSLSILITFEFISSVTYASSVSNRGQMWLNISKQWPESWLPKLALINSTQMTVEKNDLLSVNQSIDVLEDLLKQNPSLTPQRKLLAQIYRKHKQNTNALTHYNYILRQSEPSEEILLEAADFYEQLNLYWDANKARERINQ